MDPTALGIHVHPPPSIPPLELPISYVSYVNLKKSQQYEWFPACCTVGFANFAGYDAIIPPSTWPSWQSLRNVFIFLKFPDLDEKKKNPMKVPPGKT